MKFNKKYKAASLCFCIAVFLCPDDVFICREFVLSLLLIYINSESSEYQTRKMLVSRRKVFPLYGCSSRALDFTCPPGP